ncbi:MAG: imidazole glycerol phosphate synthase subunit HisH [Chloroflexota bacterium]|nr:imidazole glycerol phosphate synthase subunit HisH [Chloroflexota bacterium]
MLAVIDYGAGNLRSVLHALTHLGAASIRVVRSPEELRGAEKIILPGVGAFGAGMQKLEEQRLIQPIRDAVYAGTPYLGICLGMQFLFDCSDEMGDHRGLGILPGRVTRFNDLPGYKVPHMGWNTLRELRESSLLANLPPERYAYFVHSYYCVPADARDVLAVVDYGIPFTAVVQREHIFGVQFHPEKSQRTGLQLLTNFLEM